MRDFDKFNKIISTGSTREEFVNIAKKALFSSETTSDEISVMLKRYDIQEFFDITSLKNFINELTIQRKILPLLESLQVFIQNIYLEQEENESPFVCYIIFLITSDFAEQRLLGRKLFDSIKPSIMEVGIIDMQEEQQLKFVVSLTQDYGEAELRVPHICEVFNSKSKLIRESLLRVIHNYTLNYFGLFKDTINKTRYISSKELRHYKKFLKICEERFNLYASCVELHSKYFFPRIYDIACQQEKEYIQTQVNKYESLHKSPFRELFKPLTLGRGGGFRNSTGDVTPLAHISVSAVAPMMLSSKTPLEEREYLINLLEDWTIKNDEL